MKCLLIKAVWVVAEVLFEAAVVAVVERAIPAVRGWFQRMRSRRQTFA